MVKILQGEEIDAFIALRRQAAMSVDDIVAPILDDVRDRGDDALREWAERFDSLSGQAIKVNQAEIDTAEVDAEFLTSVEVAAANIRAFAQFQMPEEKEIELQPGLVAGQIIRPLESVGAYVPGGVYPLPSTLLMTAIPAQVAGVKQIVVANPRPASETLSVARMLGISNYYRIGGAQAIAAMAFGTEMVPKVDRIVGPGNAYVASAKRLLAGDVGIDMVAGPSEVAIVAEEGNAKWIAADMLAQAEHDADASAVFITSSRDFAEAVRGALKEALATLPTAETAQKSLNAFGAVLLARSPSESIDIANRLASEHLCLHDASRIKEIQHAGSIFLGPRSAESFGDYATGPNHVLPTSGVARLRGGLSVLDFVKVITYQSLQAEATSRLAPIVATLARAEGLEAHARAAEVRQ